MEPRTPPITLHKNLLSAMAEAIAEPWTGTGIVATSVLAAVTSRVGFLYYNPKEIVGLVFPIAGTIVALSLPAAQLSIEMLSKAEEQSLKILAREDGDGVNYVVKEIKDYRDPLFAAWRAIVLALISFLLAACGSLGMFYGGIAFDLLATASLATFVASAIWLFPAVKFALLISFGLITTIEQIGVGLSHRPVSHDVSVGAGGITVAAEPTSSAEQSHPSSSAPPEPPAMPGVAR